MELVEAAEHLDSADSSFLSRSRKHQSHIPRRTWLSPVIAMAVMEVTVSLLLLASIETTTNDGDDFGG